MARYTWDYPLGDKAFVVADFLLVLIALRIDNNQNIQELFDNFITTGVV